MAASVSAALLFEVWMMRWGGEVDTAGSKYNKVMEEKLTERGGETRRIPCRLRQR